MPEDGDTEKIKADIDVWQPTTPEADQKFFDSVALQLRGIKENYLRRAPSDPQRPDRIPNSLEYLSKRLRALQPGDAVPIARVGNTVVGFILVRWDEREQRTQIEQFYVDYAYQGRGIGTELLDHALRHARESRQGTSKGVFLTTGEKNTGAQRLYKERFGFHPSSTPADDPGEIRMDLDFEKV